MSDSPIFSLEGVGFVYPGGGRNVLSGVDLSIDAGDFACIVGPNGAGKSTLLGLLTAWLRPSAGTIRFRDRDVQQWDRRAIAREIAVVPQREEGVFPYSAAEVVRMGRFAHRGIPGEGDDDEERAIAHAALRLAGIDDLADRPVGALSGGERQLVLLARALAQCPKVLLLDEPTASLDPAHQRQVFSLLDDLNSKHGVTIVAISHDINLAAMFARRLLVLHKNHIYADGPPEEILDPAVLRPVFGDHLTLVQREDGLPMMGLVK